MAGPSPTGKTSIPPLSIISGENRALQHAPDEANSIEPIAKPFVQDPGANQHFLIGKADGVELVVKLCVLCGQLQKPRATTIVLHCVESTICPSFSSQRHAA
ncbi:unnamed protein product [Ectocarpus sp. CCAP 1310/34]|nr:unnamed protein product [Ectocarpus sp. CCAP 1310/34]